MKGEAWSGAGPRLPQGGPPGRGLGRSDSRAMGCPERASGARVFAKSRRPDFQFCQQNAASRASRGDELRI